MKRRTAASSLGLDVQNVSAALAIDLMLARERCILTQLLRCRSTARLSRRVGLGPDVKRPASMFHASSRHRGSIPRVTNRHLYSAAAIS